MSRALQFANGILLVAVAVCSGITGSGVMGSWTNPVSATDNNVVTLATSLSESPFKLSEGQTQVPLDSTAKEVINRMGRAHVEPPIQLLLEQLRADQPPGYQLEVLLGALDGTDSSAQFLGHINIFNLQQPMVFFDATEAVKTLADGSAGDRRLVVIVQPPAISEQSSKPEPEAGMHPGGTQQSEITVARARLVAQ
jgi:hypothetical protein